MKENKADLLRKISLKKVLLLAFIFVLNNSIFAQPKSTKTVDPSDAKEHFSHNNFLYAIPAYKQLLKQEPANEEYNYKLGLCYLYTNINKSLAIPYLEKASNKCYRIALELFLITII